MDWDDWSKHVDYVVRERGQWWGLGDADGNPILTLPDATTDGVTVPEQWMDSPDVSFTMPAMTPAGEQQRAYQLLIADDLDHIDTSGRLEVNPTLYTLLAAWRGKDGEIVRRGGVIITASAEDPDNDGLPQTMTISALNAADVWNTIFAVSWPAAWWAAEPYEKTTDESQLPYSRSWSMARIEMAGQAMFRWKEGKAGFVIRRLAQESLDAMMMTQADPDGTRWVDDQFHVVEVPEVDTTPVISLDAADGSLWDTVAAQARNAGVILGARVWWPGDPAVRCWNQVTSSMTPAQVDISPSQGTSQRTLAYRTFPHAMIVLTVKEVANA